VKVFARGEVEMRKEEGDEGGKRKGRRDEMKSDKALTKMA